MNPQASHVSAAPSTTGLESQAGDAAASAAAGSASAGAAAASAAAEQQQQNGSTFEGVGQRPAWAAGSLGVAEMQRLLAQCSGPAPQIPTAEEAARKQQAKQASASSPVVSKEPLP